MTPRLAASLLAVMVLAPACASTPRGPSTATGAPQVEARRTEAGSAKPSDTTLTEPETAAKPPDPADCERQVRAAHASHLTHLALQHGVGGTLYLSFVGAAQGAFYGAISGGGSGAGLGAWIGAAAGAGVGLVLGSIEGWSQAQDARAAYAGAIATCRGAALAPPAAPVPPAPPLPPPPATPAGATLAD